MVTSQSTGSFVRAAHRPAQPWDRAFSSMAAFCSFYIVIARARHPLSFAGLRFASSWAALFSSVQHASVAVGRSPIVPASARLAAASLATTVGVISYGLQAAPGVVGTIALTEASNTPASEDALARLLIPGCLWIDVTSHGIAQVDETLAYVLFATSLYTIFADCVYTLTFHTFVYDAFDTIGPFGRAACIVSTCALSCAIASVTPFVQAALHPRPTSTLTRALRSSPTRTHERPSPGAPSPPTHTTTNTPPQRARR